VQRLLATYKEEILDRQYQLARVANAAIELYVSRCVLSRLDTMLTGDHDHQPDHATEVEAGRYYLLTAARRIRRQLADLRSNDDAETTHLADRLR
jgi:hypothetical protein